MSAPRCPARAEAMPRAVGQDRVDGAARCRPSGRSGSISSRRNCCPPCRRACSAHASKDRPERTVFPAAARRSGGRARGPARRSRCAAPASTCSTRRRYLEQSITTARLTVWPHWLVPPPRASTGAPGVARDRQRRHHVLDACAAPPRRAASPGRCWRRSHSARGRPPRTGFPPASRAAVVPRGLRCRCRWRAASDDHSAKFGPWAIPPCGPYPLHRNTPGEPDDARSLELADAERSQGAYRRRGAGNPLQGHSGQHRRGRAVQAGIPGDHAEPPHPRDRRPGRAGRQADHAVRVGRDPHLSGRENRRKTDPEGSGRALQMPANG